MRAMALNLRMTDAQADTLARLAESQGLSKNEAAVRAIEEAWTTRAHEAQVRDLARSATERYGPLLDRLSQ